MNNSGKLRRAARLLPLVPALTCACATLRPDAKAKAVHIHGLDNNRRLSYEQKVPQLYKWADKFTDDEFSPARLPSYSSDTLRLLLDSLDTVAFYSYGAPGYVAKQELAFNEMETRNLLRDSDIERMYLRFLAARMFDKARTIRERFPAVTLWQVPKIIETDAPAGRLYRVYDISADSQTATAIFLPMSTGPRIIIAANGGCPVAGRALRSIEADKRLSEALRSSGVILSIRFEPGGIAYLNAKSRTARWYVAARKQDWPGIDFSMSPNFYFMKDGKVLQQFQGWGRDAESLRDFAKGLERIGLGGS